MIALLIFVACDDDKEITDDDTNSTSSQQNEVSEEPSMEPSEEIIPCDMTVMRTTPTHVKTSRNIS